MRLSRLRTEDSGQAVLLAVGAMAALVAGALILGAIGQALGAKGHAQRAADLAAVSAARAMRDAYPRLFEPPYLRRHVPNPRHLSRAGYLALAGAAAVEGARLNGAILDPSGVSFPERDSFAPVRVTVTLSRSTSLRISSGGRTGRVRVVARATAALTPGSGAAYPGAAAGAGYSGPLAYRQGKGMRPDVAPAFDRMAAAARREAGIALLITSAYRSDAEQARLYAAHPDPKWVAPPGQSLHRYGTELDLGPPSAYPWLAANAHRFGFIQRYSWVFSPISVGTRKDLLGGGSVAQRTIGLESGRLGVGIAPS